MAKRRYIPFGLLPGSWGLAGKTRQVAEAEYYLQGEELERRLIEITTSDPIEREYLYLDVDLKYEHIDQYTYDVRHAHIAYTAKDKLARALLEIKHQHGRLADYDYDKQCVECDTETDSLIQKLALLDIELKHGKVTDRQCELQRANLKEEPYIAVIRSEYDPRQGLNGLYFEFDWNPLWIAYLRLNGYIGISDEELVEQWFSDICRSASEAEEEAGPPLTSPFNSRRVIRQVRRDGGQTEYS